MNGFLQVGFLLPALSDTVRHLAAVASEEPIITICDCDTVFSARANSPKNLYGHGAATMWVNPRTSENRDMMQKIIHRHIDYCQFPKDDLKIATPVRYMRQQLENTCKSFHTSR